MDARSCTPSSHGPWPGRNCAQERLRTGTSAVRTAGVLARSRFALSVVLLFSEAHSSPEDRDRKLHQGIILWSRTNLPRSEAGASSASQTAVSAPWVTSRSAFGPPMSVFTLPGQMELTHLGWCSKAGATTMAVTTIMKIETRTTEFRRKAPRPTAVRR